MNQVPASSASAIQKPVNPYAQIVKNATAGPGSVTPPAMPPVAGGAPDIQPLQNQVPSPADIVGSKGPVQFSPYTSTAGHVAGIADDILRGFMAGKAIREQKQQQQAMSQVQGSAQLWHQAADGYQQAQAQARAKGLNPDTDPSVAPYANAANVAWQNYNNVRTKYAFGDDGSQPAKGGKSKSSKVASELKGVKTELGHIFGNQSPEMFPRAILQHFSQMTGTQAAALGPAQAQQQQQAALQGNIQQQQMDDQIADRNAIKGMQAISSKYGSSDQSTWAPADVAKYNGYHATYESNLTPPQREADAKARQDETIASIQERIAKGDPTVTDTQRMLVKAYAAPKFTPRTIVEGNRTVLLTTNDSTGQVTREDIGPAPDGAVTGTPVYGYNSDGQWVRTGTEYRNKQGALISTSRIAPQPTAGSQPNSHEQGAINDAVNAANQAVMKMANAGKSNPNANNPFGDNADALQGLGGWTNNFYYTDPADPLGNVHLRTAGPAVTGTTGTGPSPVSNVKGTNYYWGNVPQSSMPAVQNAWRNAFAKELVSRGIPKRRIDAILGSPLYGAGGAASSAPVAAPAAAPVASPGSATSVLMRAPDGTLARVPAQNVKKAIAAGAVKVAQ